MNILSLFANIGVAEAYLEKLGFNVVLANESVKRRASLYSKIYPKSRMICGDFTDENIFSKIVEESKLKNIDIVMATPPCQGMSNAGLQKKDDKRNELILSVITLVELILPKYCFIENVPLFLKTEINYQGENILIPDLILKKLSSKYHIVSQVIDTKDYNVPQSRQRAIILLTKKGHNPIWSIPEKTNKIMSLEDVIGDIPIIDPFIKDISEDELLEMFPNFHERKKTALKISKWNNPPVHIKRQVLSMIYTPTGATAFDNKKEFQPVKLNGELVKGFKNTYKRQNWHTPAFTVTMDNRKISSQNNVHPGRLIAQNENGDNIYSDPRTLTLYEIMKIMSIPDDWPLPADTSEAFVRSIIGEGIPPVFVKSIFEKLLSHG